MKENNLFERLFSIKTKDLFELNSPSKQSNYFFDLRQKFI